MFQKPKEKNHTYSALTKPEF